MGCHPRIRAIVLDDMTQCVNESEPVRKDFMMWLLD